jgi:hypothetical protein
LYCVCAMVLLLRVARCSRALADTAPLPCEGPCTHTWALFRLGDPAHAHTQYIISLFEEAIIYNISLLSTIGDAPRGVEWVGRKWRLKERETRGTVGGSAQIQTLPPPAVFRPHTR